MLLSTRRDLLCNFHGQLERGGRLETGDLRLPAGAGAFEKRGQLTFERLALFDFNFRSRNLPLHAPINFAALVFVIEREISIALENANLSHALGTNAARCDVRNATVFKAQSRVRDVFAPAQNRDADRVDA